MYVCACIVMMYQLCKKPIICAHENSQFVLPWLMYALALLSMQPKVVSGKIQGKSFKAYVAAERNYVLRTR